MKESFWEKDKERSFLFKTNPIVRALTISDIFVLSGLGLINPIFAVFLTDSIPGGSLQVAGIASMIYLLTKSLGQLPAAYIIDRIKGERDDFWAMLAGSFITSVVPIFYLFARAPMHVYFIQFFYGLGQAFSFPSWMAIFTRHIDTKKEGVQWGIYYTCTDLAGAGAAALGGVIASNIGFPPLFVLVSFFTFIGSCWLLWIYKKVNKPPSLPVKSLNLS